MKEPSIYHEYKDYEYLRGELNDVIPWEIGLEGGFGNYGYSIIKILAKYTWLNKKNIELCINMNNPTEWKRTQLSKALKMLRKGNYITAVGFKENEEEKNYVVVLYGLTQKAADLLVERKERVKPQICNELTIDSVQYMLKKASINQWHISTLRSYKGIVTKSSYNTFKIDKDSRPVPSMTCATVHQKNNESRGIIKKITLFAYPAPRKEEDLKEFLIEIIRLQNYLTQTKQFRPALIVAVCENLQHASWLSWKINKYRQTRPFYVEYSMDMVTSQDDPLRLLYDCSTDEEGIVHSSLNIIDNK